MDNGGVALMEDIPVNTYTAGDQTNADICSLSDGGYVAVWQSAGQDGDGNGIYAKRFNEIAQEQGGEFRVNTRTTGNQISPVVAGLSGGGFVIVWQSNIHDGDGDGIFGQRYTASGVAQGSEFQVKIFTIDAQTNPNVASVADGGFVVTWQSNKQDGDGLGIYAQRSGSKLGRELQVNTNTTGNQQFPVITGLKDGNFVISWQSATGLYGQMFGGVWHPGSTLNQQSLTVYQGETIVLNSTLLNASDNMIDNNTLLFMVNNVDYCQFERVAQPGIAISNFTQQEVIVGEIQLVHELSVKPGKKVVLGSSHFQASYGDTSPGELVYMVSQVQHGRFVLTSDLNIVITQFTHLQIDKGEIQFVHDGSQENPSFIAWVSNGPYQSSEYTVTVSFDLPTTENSVRKKSAIIGGVVGGVGGCLALSCCVAVTVALMGLCVVKNKKKKPVKKVDLEKGIEMCTISLELPSQVTYQTLKFLLLKTIKLWIVQEIYNIIGHYTSSINFGSASPPLSGGHFGVYVVKISSAGAFLWTLYITAAPDDNVIGSSVVVDNNQNVFISGFITGSAIFSYDPNTVGPLTGGSTFLVKLNPSGVPVSKRIGTASPPKLSIDSLNTIYAAGPFADSVSFGVDTTTLTASLSAFYLYKFTSTLGFLSGTSSDDSTTFLSDVNIDTNTNGESCVGTFRRSLKVDALPTIVSSGTVSAFVVKYNSAQVPQYLRLISSTNLVRGGGVHIDTAGNCYISGSFQNSLSFRGHICNWIFILFFKA